MFDISQDDHDDKVKNTYEQLAIVIETRNEIISNTEVNEKSLTKNEVKKVEMENVLQNLREEITSNEILKKINANCHLEYTHEQKCLENIYTEFNYISNSLDSWEEKDVQMKQEFTKLQSMVSNLEKALDNEIEKLTLQYELQKNFKNNSKNKMKNELIQEDNNLKLQINELLHQISNEKYNIELFNLQLREEQDKLQRTEEEIAQYKKSILENSSLEDKTMLNIKTHIAEFEECQHKLSEKITELNNNCKTSEDCINVENKKLLVLNNIYEDLKPKIEETEFILTKQNLYYTIQIQKDVLIKKIVETDSFKAALNDKENYFSEIKIEKQCVQDNLNAHKIEYKLNVIENIKRDKENITIKINELQTNLQNTVKELENLTETNKNKEFLLTHIYIDKETFVQNDNDIVKGNLNIQAEEINNLNGNIVQLQKDIEAKQKYYGTFNYDLKEKETNELYHKIQKYLKAIEDLKKRRLIEAYKSKSKSSFCNQDANSSEDSIFAPKKPRQK